MTRTFRTWLGLLAVLFLSALSIHAQVAGRLSGSVVDQTGASIPGATVNVFVPGGKEPVLSGSTNEAGLFTFMAVRPDTYDIVIEAKGFTKTAVREVKVAPVQETGLPAIKLQVQASTTTVDVTSDVESVQLTNAENAATITATQVQNLPVLGRQVSTLFQTQVGVTPTSGTTSVNGLRSSFTNITLDGVNIQDNFIRTNGLDYAPMRTTIDQVAEITVSTSNEGAAIGGGASQMIMSTKSGSNTFHGSAYWYNRNNALSANDWFNNKSGVVNPKLNLNQPGAAVGGHIIRDKLFFYTNYELYRNKKQNVILNTVLTDSAKNGIFTYNGGSQSIALSKLRTFVLDPTTKAMMAQLPAPNTTDAGDGMNTSGYRFNAKANEYRDQFVYKGDYYLNSKNSFTGTYNFINNPTDRTDAGPFYGVTPPVRNVIKDHLLSASWRWTASPTLTNELRGGFMRSATSFLDNDDYPKSLVLGLLYTSPVNTFLNQGRDVNTYNFQDNATWLKGKHEISFGIHSQQLRLRVWNDAGILPSYTLGVSTAYADGLKTTDLPGIGSSDLNTANNLLANLAGIVTTAAQTFNVTSRTSGFVPGANSTRNLSYSNYAGYIQDKWKVRSNLTLNLGLRYEYWNPMDEKEGLFLAPVLQGNDAKATILNPNGTLDFIGGSSGRPFYKIDKNNFAPNVGFAWDPFKSGKTSVRGGYMMAFVNDNMVTTVRSNLNNNSGLSFGNTMNNLAVLLSGAPTVPAPAYKVPRTFADNFAITKTTAFGMPDPNLVTPTVHQWTLGIQHDYKGTVFNVRYVGNKGSDLLRSVDYNQILYNANGFLADFLRAQSNAGLAQAAGLGYNGAYNANVPGSQVLTVFPLIGSAGNFGNATIQTYLRQGQVAELANSYMTGGTNGSVNFYPNPNAQSAYVITNGGSSTYHGLQAEVTRRVRDVQLQFNYTFSNALSNTTGDLQTGLEPLLDNNNPSLEYARSPYDIKHSLKANYYYELPFGKGKRFSGGPVQNLLLGGWAVSGVWSYHSGSPYSILSGYGTLNRAGRATTTNTASVNGTNWGTLAPLTTGVFMTGNGPYFISPSLINTDGRGAAQAGNAPFAGEVFYNPTAGNVGNLQRRMFSGPWTWSWDASVIKTFAIHERHKVEMHLDVTNWANHPTFYVYPSSGDYGTQGVFTVNNTSFGKIQSMNLTSRIIQIGAYYRF